MIFLSKEHRRDFMSIRILSGKEESVFYKYRPSSLHSDHLPGWDLGRWFIFITIITVTNCKLFVNVTVRDKMNKVYVME